MKLYATTTSERASKGQGGNDYLEINITDDVKNILASIGTKPKEKWLSNPIIQICYNSHIVDIKIHDMAKESSNFWGISEKTKEVKNKMDNWKY